MEGKCMEKIDFVIAWVDGGDPSWNREKSKYLNSTSGDDSSSGNVRYRDWEQLRYWFRGVEKFAPWVNNIFFVTCGQKPEWLNENHPKLKLINHEDYIPKEFLPTFSANPIELNFHRIKELGEKFVYFNDDMFIVNPVRQEDFFKNNLPCDTYIESPLRMSGCGSAVSYMLVNDSEIINKYFKRKNVIKDRIFDYINPKYGIKTICKTMMMWQYSLYSGFDTPHLPSSFLKSTYNEVWECERELLEKVSSNKFRSNEDVNQYLFKYWQLCSHKFYPRNIKFGESFSISDENEKIKKAITGKKYKKICINDSPNITDFEKTKKDINNSFEVKFRKKSSFEK